MNTDNVQGTEVIITNSDVDNNKAINIQENDEEVEEGEEEEESQPTTPLNKIEENTSDEVIKKN